MGVCMAFVERTGATIAPPELAKRLSSTTKLLALEMVLKRFSSFQKPTHLVIKLMSDPYQNQ